MSETWHIIKIICSRFQNQAAEKIVHYIINYLQTRGIMLKNKIHFVGIGGIGMSGIAEFYIIRFAITGSDLKIRNYSTLSARIKVEEGHRPENLGDADVVVKSSAVTDDNPEHCS